MDNDVVDLILKINRAKQERDSYAGVSSPHYDAKNVYVETLEKQLAELKASKKA